MSTSDIILRIFCLVDDSLPNIPKHPQAKLYPSELVTIGILFALKGGFFRAFYRSLKRDYGDWFGDGTLPERSRLQRLLKTHQDWCDSSLADPTFFTVMDRYPTALLFPIRQGRSSRQLGKKRSRQRSLECRNQVLLAVERLLSGRRMGLGHHERKRKHFNRIVAPLVGTTIVPADYGFRDQNGVPENMKVCKNGTWDERMCVETALSRLCSVCLWICSTRFIPMPTLTR